MKFTSQLKPIKLQEVVGKNTRTYESTWNLTRSAGLRNIQKTRGGPVFAGALQKQDNRFPLVSEVIQNNSTLKRLYQR